MHMEEKIQLAKLAEALDATIVRIRAENDLMLQMMSPDDVTRLRYYQSMIDADANFGWQAVKQDLVNRKMEMMNSSLNQPMATPQGPTWPLGGGGGHQPQPVAPNGHNDNGSGTPDALRPLLDQFKREVESDAERKITTDPRFRQLQASYWAAKQQAMNQQRPQQQQQQGYGA